MNFDVSTRGRRKKKGTRRRRVAYWVQGASIGKEIQKGTGRSAQKPHGVTRPFQQTHLKDLVERGDSMEETAHWPRSANLSPSSSKTQRPTTAKEHDKWHRPPFQEYAAGEKAEDANQEEASLAGGHKYVWTRI